VLALSGHPCYRLRSDVGWRSLVGVLFLLGRVGPAALATLELKSALSPGQSGMLGMIVASTELDRLDLPSVSLVTGPDRLMTQCLQ
jgi:hypothetical protein